LSLSSDLDPLEKTLTESGQSYPVTTEGLRLTLYFLQKTDFPREVIEIALLSLGSFCTRVSDQAKE
jgi:hypothetical protein